MVRCGHVDASNLVIHVSAPGGENFDLDDGVVRAVEPHPMDHATTAGGSIGSGRGTDLQKKDSSGFAKTKPLIFNVQGLTNALDAN